ncbi:MAG: serpin family protein [Kiritimatiellae bacterium]|nr:serpin family protein [Kiritimatiellia bacterium]
MKLVARRLSFVVLCARASGALAPGAAAQSPWRQADFAADLHRRAVAAAEKDANVVVSPWGVASLFAMLQTGARGDTARGMAFALQLGGVEPPEPDDVCKTFREARTALSRAAREDVALELSDSLWIKPGFALSESFRSCARDAFDADVRLTEMGAAGRKAINEFVSEKTHGRIPNLLAAPVLDDPLTRLVAVDTIYLKAEWSDPFDPKETSDRTFHAPSGDFVTPFMHATRDAEILDAPECAALRLPYRGGTLEMLVLLPSPSNTLADVEARLGRPFLDRLAATPWRGLADVALPKFEFDSEHDLRPILEPMGMGAAFDPGRADFSGIAPQLYIGTALQKANVTVDEEGTEAAAATVALMLEGCIGPMEDVPPPRPFVADRPFLFLIRETRTGLVLFLGRVSKPTPPAPRE